MAKTMFDNLNAIVANTITDSIKMIDIDELHESEDNFFLVERIEEFAETIMGQGGVKDNLIVRPLETGGYEVISGHRRRAAVKYLIDKGENVSHYLPCLVQEYTDEDSKLLDIILMNVTARQISDSEMWRSYEIVDRILKEKKSGGEKFGRIREKLADYLGVSPAQVGKMQNVEKNAIDEVKQAVENGDISISTANEIAKLDEDEQEKLVQNDLSGVKHKDVKKLNEAEKDSFIKWDGVLLADEVKERLLKIISSAEKDAAKHMNNSDFTGLIRKNHKTEGFGGGGLPFVKCSFDKVVIKFNKPIDDEGHNGIVFTWSMAARHIRYWICGENDEDNATEEISEKVDTYINSEDSAAAEPKDDNVADEVIAADQTDNKFETTEKVDTYINFSEDEADEPDEEAADDEQYNDVESEDVAETVAPSEITMKWDGQAFKEEIMEGLSLLIKKIDDLGYDIIGMSSNDLKDILQTECEGFITGYQYRFQSVVIRCKEHHIGFDFQHPINNLGASIVTVNYKEAAESILAAQNNDVSEEAEDEPEEEKKAPTYINSDKVSAETAAEKLIRFVCDNYYDITDILDSCQEMTDMDYQCKLIEQFSDILSEVNAAERNKIRFGG